MKILESKHDLNWDYDGEADALYICLASPKPAVGIDIGEGVIVRYADLTGAKLVTANLGNAILIRANLFLSILLNTDLTRANLSGTNLSHAIGLTQAQLDQARAGPDDLPKLDGRENSVPLVWRGKSLEDP